MNLQRVTLAIIRILFLGNGGDGKRQRKGGGQQTGEQFSKIQGEVIVSLFNFGGLAFRSMREARAKSILTIRSVANKTQCDRFVNEMSSLEKSWISVVCGSGLRVKELKDAFGCSVRGPVFSKLR